MGCCWNTDNKDWVRIGIGGTLGESYITSNGNLPTWSDSSTSYNFRTYMVVVGDIFL